MNEEQINEDLVRQMLPIWLSNFRENLPIIWKSKCVSDLKEELYPKTAICIGAGPSIFKNKHLELIAALATDEFKIACDKIFLPCREEGIVPDIVTSIDADPIIADFLATKITPNTRAVFATTVDPEVVRNWNGEKYFVNAHIYGKVSDELGIDRILQIISDKIVMNTSGNVGMFNFILAAYLGAKTICLVGMDMSGHHEFYSNYSKTWISGLSRDLGLRVVNCTGGGNLYNIDGMETMELAEFLESIRTNG